MITHPSEDALKIARTPPQERGMEEHLRCVYANFADYFTDWRAFLQSVAGQQHETPAKSFARTLLEFGSQHRSR